MSHNTTAPRWCFLLYWIFIDKETMKIQYGKELCWNKCLNLITRGTMNKNKAKNAKITHSAHLSSLPAYSCIFTYERYEYTRTRCGGIHPVRHDKETSKYVVDVNRKTMYLAHDPIVEYTYCQIEEPSEKVKARRPRPADVD